MIHTTSFADRIRALFAPTRRGIVGLVDDLLELCRDQPLRFDFQDGHCQVRPLGPDTQLPVVVPIPQTAFRAVVARVAALCNEHSPDRVTPYRGECELTLGTAPPLTFHVTFANSPDEQRLEIGPSTTPGIRGEHGVRS